MTNRPSRALQTLSLAILVAGWGCSTPVARAPERRLENLGAPGLHAVESEQIRKLMKELRATVFEQFPTELELDRSRSAQAAELARTARALGEAAEALVAKAPSLEVSEAERQVFADLASKLGRQAAEIENLARAEKVGEIAPALDRMVATCNACHTSFRIFRPGVAGAQP